MKVPSQSLWFLLLIAGALAAAKPAIAQRLEFRPPWVQFLDGEGMAGALDSSRVRRQGDTTELWIRFAYAETQHVPDDTARFDFTEFHAEVHCPAQQVREIRMLLRDVAGDSVTGYVDPAPSWQSFAVHPLTPKVLVRLCRKLAGRPVD